MATVQMQTGRKRQRTAGRAISNTLCYIFLIALSLLTLYPLAWMFLSSFRPGTETAVTPLTFNLQTFSINNYTALLSNVPIFQGFQNTMIVMFFKGGLELFFAPLAGFAFAKYRFRGRNLLFTLLLSTMLLPPLVMLIPLLIEMGSFGWVDTFQALIFPGAIGAFSIFWMRQSIAEVPDELLDAGRIDGCSHFGLFWRIVLPVIRPALAALAIFTFLGIYNDFVWPVVVTASDEMQTLQVMLAALASQINNAQPGVTGQDAWGQIIAASTLATVPVLILFLAMQRHFIRGILSGGVKG